MNEEIKVKCNVRILNLPTYDLSRYVVVRYHGGNLWFFGTYEDENRAWEVSGTLGNGVVFEVSE